MREVGTITIAGLLRKCLDDAQHPSTTFGVRQHNAAICVAEGLYDPKRPGIDATVDVELCGKIPALLHETLHHVMYTRMNGLEESLEEDAIRAWEERLLAYLQEHPRVLAQWRAVVREKLNMGDEP